jgi:hypothetical protein
LQINTEYLHHWMCAIRESDNPIRTMDAFWRGQIKSKEWLIEELKKHKSTVDFWPTIDIHGGWVGVLASMLFQSGLYIKSIRSIDIDPSCEKTANRMNQIEFESGRFQSVTANMCDFNSDANIIINTSCEHITQPQYDKWLLSCPQDSLFVLQSNNYNIPEHIRVSHSLEDFKNQSKLSTLLYQGELELPMYKRFMIIGKK